MVPFTAVAGLMQSLLASSNSVSCQVNVVDVPCTPTLVKLILSSAPAPVRGAVWAPTMINTPGVLELVVMLMPVPIPATVAGVACKPTTAWLNANRRLNPVTDSPVVTPMLIGSVNVDRFAPTDAVGSVTAIGGAPHGAAGVCVLAAPAPWRTDDSCGVVFAGVQLPDTSPRRIALKSCTVTSTSEGAGVRLAGLKTHSPV